VLFIILCHIGSKSTLGKNITHLLVQSILLLNVFASKLHVSNQYGFILFILTMIFGSGIIPWLLVWFGLVWVGFGLVWLLVWCRHA
jgi:hypothetical protein